MLVPLQRYADLIERIPLAGCWLWLGRLDKDGYAMAGHDSRLARDIYIDTYGDFPQYLYVCHTCDVRSCINPAHLYTATQKKNMEDSVSRSRTNAGEGVRSSTFTADMVREVVRLSRVERKSHRWIAAHFGVGRGMIHQILGGIIWNTVTGFEKHR